MSHARALGGGVAALVIALLAAGDLATPGFYAGHDNLLNVHRLVSLEGCLAEGRWLCVWAPDMGAGMGIPLFQYYPPLPTYLGAGLRLAGASLTGAVQASAAGALLVLAAGAFALARSLWGTAGGLWTAALAVTSPYVALDVYVRGALNETWGLALLPWLLLAARDRARRGGAAAGLALAAAGTALVITHPLVCLAASPLYATWLVLHGRDRTAAVRLAAPHAVALLASAFYWLPALLERDAVHRGALVGRYAWNRWSNNLLSLPELVTGTGPWDYGPFRSEGGMSVFVGGIALCAAALAVATWWRDRLDRGARAPEGSDAGADRGAGERRLVPGLALATAASLLLATTASSALWSVLPPLAYLQFPWRFLGPASLGLALVAGAALVPVARRLGPAVALALALGATAAATAWNLRYHHAEVQAVVDDHVLAAPLQLARMRHGLYDYLPAAVDPEAIPETPPSVRPPAAVALPRDSARVRAVARGSHRLALVVESREGTLLRIQRHRFPHWRVRIDGEPVPLVEYDDPRGRLHVRVPAGRHEVTATLEATPPRIAGRALSLLGIAAALALAGWERWRARPPERPAEPLRRQ